MHIEDLRPYAGHSVGVRLADGSEFSGELRTELLTDRSISVYLHGTDGQGTVLYIEDITAIWPTS